MGSVQYLKAARNLAAGVVIAGASLFNPYTAEASSPVYSSPNSQLVSVINRNVLGDSINARLQLLLASRKARNSAVTYEAPTESISSSPSIPTVASTPKDLGELLYTGYEKKADSKVTIQSKSKDYNLKSLVQNAKKEPLKKPTYAESEELKYRAKVIKKSDKVASPITNRTESHSAKNISLNRIIEKYESTKKSSGNKNIKNLLEQLKSNREARRTGYNASIDEGLIESVISSQPDSAPAFNEQGRPGYAPKEVNNEAEVVWGYPQVPTEIETQPDAQAPATDTTPVKPASKPIATPAAREEVSRDSSAVDAAFKYSASSEAPRAPSANQSRIRQLLNTYRQNETVTTLPAQDPSTGSSKGLDDIVAPKVLSPQQPQPPTPQKIALRKAVAVQEFREAETARPAYMAEAQSRTISQKGLSGAQIQRAEGNDTAYNRSQTQLKTLNEALAEARKRPTPPNPSQPTRASDSSKKRVENTPEKKRTSIINYRGRPASDLEIKIETEVNSGEIKSIDHYTSTRHTNNPGAIKALRLYLGHLDFIESGQPRSHNTPQELKGYIDELTLKGTPESLERAFKTGVLLSMILHPEGNFNTLYDREVKKFRLKYGGTTGDTSSTTSPDLPPNFEKFLQPVYANESFVAVVAQKTAEWDDLLSGIVIDQNIIDAVKNMYATYGLEDIQNVDRHLKSLT